MAEIFIEGRPHRVSQIVKEEIDDLNNQVKTARALANKIENELEVLYARQRGSQTLIEGYLKELKQLI